MDLLAGYGSDSDQSSGDTGQETGKVTLVPPSQPADSGPSHAGPKPSAALPPLNKARSTLSGPSAEGGSVSGGLLSRLPAPGAGGASTSSKRKPVQFRVPLNFNPPPDSDSEDEAPKKRIKAGPGVKLTDCLPAPKHNVLGAGSARRLGGGLDDGGAAGAFSAPTRPAAATQNAELAYQVDNESYRVDEAEDTVHGVYPEASAVPTGFFEPGAQPYEPYASEPYPTPAQPAQPWVGPSAQYPAHPAVPQGSTAPSQGTGPNQSTAMGNGAAALLSEGDRLLQEALLAEAEKVKRRTAKDPFADLGVKLVEVKQEKLTYVNPSKREAMKGARAALGAGYEAKLRDEAGPQPDKTARRKHQISSLYHQAKMKELEMMEQRGQSLKTKSETQAKYGWS